MFSMYMQQIAFNNNGKTITYICFYPCDTVLAVTQHLSVTSRCSIETAERTELVIGMEASFYLSSYSVL